MSLSADALIQGVKDAYTTRYLSTTGMILVLYDHMLTISDECEFIWKMPPSFPKYAFLFNRYTTPCVMFVAAIEMCGFNGVSFSDIEQVTCRLILSATSLAGVLSTGVANSLILLRILALWKENRAVRVHLCCTYVFSICTFYTLMIVACYSMWDGVKWLPVVNMCVIINKPKVFVAMWATPMFFELTVLGSVAFNAMSSPRSANVPLTIALRKDGITFFLTVASLRFFQAVVAGTARPSLESVGIHFVWGGVTTALNRSFISMRKAEVYNSLWSATSDCSSLRRSTMSPSDVPPSEFIEMTGALQHK